MERKGFFGKENREGNVLYTALSKSFTHGDKPLMKTSRLKEQSRQSDNLKIYFNKPPRGDTTV